MVPIHERGGVPIHERGGETLPSVLHQIWRLHIFFNEKYIGYEDILRNLRRCHGGQGKVAGDIEVILKAELKGRNTGYRELAERLTAMGARDRQEHGQ